MKSKYRGGTRASGCTTAAGVRRTFTPTVNKAVHARASLFTVCRFSLWRDEAAVFQEGLLLFFLSSLVSLRRSDWSLQGRRSLLSAWGVGVCACSRALRCRAAPCLCFKIFGCSADGISQVSLYGRKTSEWRNEVMQSRRLIK